MVNFYLDSLNPDGQGANVVKTTIVKVEPYKNIITTLSYLVKRQKLTDRIKKLFCHLCTSRLSIKSMSYL